MNYIYCFQSSKIMQMIREMLDWIRSLFWMEEMELTLVGLQHAGKTTFVKLIALGELSKVFLDDLVLKWE